MPEPIRLVNHKYAMRWKELLEAPIGNYDAVGVNDEGSFKHRQDRSIIASTKAEQKIRRLLANVPQTIDIVFLDTGFKTDDGNEQNQHWLEIAGPRDYAQMRATIPGFPMRSGSDAIMLVLTNNEGANRVQLSGWIVAHRMGHALTFGSDFESRFQNIQYSLHDLQAYWRDGWMTPAIEVCYAIGRMKSCRERNLTQTPEFTYECFAQYIVQGSVTFHRLDAETAAKMNEKTKGDWGYVPPIREDDIARFNEMIDFAESNINTICASILKAAEGLVVVL
jgi:hypothetical protein